jgi:3-hydroxyacyl-[acyl-carrier-protein] dehydratase
MAQTSGWLVVALNGYTRMPFLAQVKEAKLRTFVVPGQRLTVDAQLEHDGSGFAVTSAKIKADGKLICDARLTFRVVDFPNPEMVKWMRDTAATFGLSIEAPANG